MQELKNQIQAERQKERQATMAAAAMGDPALASATPAQRTAAAAYGPTGVAAPCVPGQPCSQLQQGDTQMQLTPLQQQAQLIAAKERERADNSRFASNLVYSRLRRTAATTAGSGDARPVWARRPAGKQ